MSLNVILASQWSNTNYSIHITHVLIYLNSSSFITLRISVAKFSAVPYTVIPLLAILAAINSKVNTVGDRKRTQTVESPARKGQKSRSKIS